MANEKRLIDANALIEDLEAAKANNGMGGIVASTLIRYVKRCPTVDAAEVVHGRWIEKEYCEPWGGYYLFHCSECDTPNAQERNYCPNCGAKMDGDGNGT